MEIKIHFIEDHAVIVMKCFKGIEDYCEDFIERAHQDTTKEQNLVGCLKDRTKKAKYIETRRTISSIPAHKQQRKK